MTSLSPASIYLGICSIALVVFECRLLFQTIKLLTQGIRAAGTVVSKGTTTDRNIVLTYPIVEFVATDGEKMQIAGQASYPDRVKIGKAVTVLYLQESPEKARVRNFGTLILPPLAVFLLAGVCIFALLHPRR